MKESSSKKRSISWVLPLLVSFLVFPLGLSPLALFFYVFFRYAPLSEIWFYFLVPSLLCLLIAFEIIFVLLVSGAFVRLFHLYYQPGTYLYSSSEKNAVKWVLVCLLYTPLRKIIEIVPVGGMKNVYLRLLGMKIGSNCLVGGVIKDPCVSIFGDNVTMGEYAIIYGHIHNYEKRTITIAPVEIGDNCVIGAGAILMPGVRMENDSGVAAGAVVPKNSVLQAGKIYAGVPAREL